ncbi:MAG: hypothetical protein ABJE66_28850 [Deltaproteobacteria bacterium]
MVLRVRGLLWAACCIASVAYVSPSQAAKPRAGARLAADTLTALPAANIAKPLRIVKPLVALATPPVAWMALAGTGGHWQATWDPATGVPRQIWGSLAAPGANGDAAVAERIARAMLAAHVDLMAPGASASDFQLVSNTSDGKIRSIGFFQYAGGHRVVGGQLGFWFENDRLFVMTSEALPHVTFATTRARVANLAQRATSTLRDAVALPAAPVVASGDDVIVPLVADGGVLGYRLASPFTIDGGADGRYLAFIDPGSAGVIAVQQLNDYAAGVVQYLGTDRYPARGRVAYPASRAHEMVAGVAETTDQGGGVTWDDSLGSSVTVTTTDGDLVTIVDGINPLSAGTFTLDPGGTLVWDASAVVENDAQVNAYLNASQAKAFVRANVDPAMATLEDQLKVNVNLAQDCNAFFDGTALNFFHRTAMCENTALIQDVVYHEYGHRVHSAEVIQGVGAVDGAMGEGVADTLAVNITGDSGMGRGFFFTDTALRELDPPDKEWRWPTDIGEIHHTGMIIGGAYWDLRKALIAELGQTAGEALTLKLYVGALRRSVDIPTSLLATLAADDDDGDITNGTPHECEIRGAYGLHGLRTVTGSVDAPGQIDDIVASVPLHISVSGLSSRCASDALGTTSVSWSAIIDGDPKSGQITTISTAPNEYTADLPLAPYDDTVFQVRVGFTDGSVFTLPDNLADAYYQVYTGHVIPLYCTDFEADDPFANGWIGTTNGNTGNVSTWTWATPASGLNNPHAAFSGTKVLAQVPDTNYAPTTQSTLAMPPIDVGKYTDVRLQYRRWLTVEDSHFDQATIKANGKQVWINTTANMGDSSSTHHLDKEWRFQDVSLTPFFFGHQLQIQFGLASDAGLQFGGWTLDDVCIVANPNSICGDGIKTVTESCDNGSANADAPDKCRTFCKLPQCGDGIVDSSEECDTGAASVTCDDKCKIIVVAEGGCCSASGGTGSLLLSLGVLASALRRRRRPSRHG